MKNTRYTLLGAMMFAVTCAGAWAEDLSAYKAMRAAQNQVRPDIKMNIVEIKGENGKPNPAKWDILFYDPKESGKLVRVIMQGGELLEQSRPMEVFDQTTKKRVMNLSKVKLDSDKAFKIAQGVCEKQNNVIATRANYVLRKVKKDDPESLPIWDLTLYDNLGNYLGKLLISATSGAVLRSEKLKYDGTRKLTFDEEVESTFLGIGGELEEFFTGDRTVDQDSPSNQMQRKKGSKN